MKYVITDYNDKERRRLGALAALTDPYTFHVLEKINIKSDWHCLEIGAGLGTVSQWIAERLDEKGEVLCTDLQPDFIQDIKHPRIRTQKLDITVPPEISGQCDLAVIRAVHQHIPDRYSAIRNLVQMVQPGGHILYVEPDIHPALCDEHPVWNRLWKALFEWGERREIDYFTGRRVAGQLAQAGMEIIAVRGETALFNGSAKDDAAHEVYRMTFELLMPEFVNMGLLSKADQIEAEALFENPEVWMMGFCFFATHARKPAGTAR